MATNQQHDQEIPTIVPQSESERIEEIDVAQADESDRYVIAKHRLTEDLIHFVCNSWETDDEGDFYTEDVDDERLAGNDEDDEENSVDIGLPKPLIKCYPTTTAEEVSVVGAVCDICLTEYKSDDQLRTIPCLHRFHMKCIDKWLKVRIVNRDFLVV